MVVGAVTVTVMGWPVVIIVLGTETVSVIVVGL